MWRLVLLFSVFMAAASAAEAQSSSVLESAIYILGAESPETVDADELERILAYVDRPLELNRASTENMVSSGLMTAYQAAALKDYRDRHGSLMSFAELAAVDGFGEEYVRRIAPFVSLGSMASASFPESRKHCLSMAGRTGLKMTGDEREVAGSYGFKARIESYDRLGISLSANSSRSFGPPDSWSACVAYRFKTVPARIVVGDFSARFGQGLALWSGMTMSGVAAPSALLRTPSGLSEVWSFTGANALTGVAGDLSLQRLKITALLASPGLKDGFSSLLPAVNMMWRGKTLHLGLTHYSDTELSVERGRFIINGMKTSVDMAACVNGVDLFSELAYDWAGKTAACVAGSVFPLWEHAKGAAMLRYYPAEYDPVRSGAARSGSRCSNEYAAALSCSISGRARVRMAGVEGFGADVSRHSGVISADAAYYPVPKSASGKSIQVKFIADWTFMLSGSFRLKVRAVERIRTWGQPFRTDVRADISCSSSQLTAAVRLNLLRCRRTGYLAFAECGCRTKKLSAYVRQGFFVVDEWDDRIYVYERDAPGSFNVPAFYGRGLWSSLSGSWKFCRDGRLYLRASYVGYPFMEKKKPGKAELKLQCVFNL